MKLIIIAVVLGLSGCAQLMKGELQPVVLKGDNVFFTSCSGTVEDWFSCNSKAKKKCAGGYEVLDRVESAPSGRRELTFSCK